MLASGLAIALDLEEGSRSVSDGSVTTKATAAEPVKITGLAAL